MKNQETARKPKKGPMDPDSTHALVDPDLSDASGTLD